MSGKRAQAVFKKLQLKLLESLPFFQHLAAPPELLQLVLEDYHKAQKVDAAQKVVDKAVKNATKDGYTAGNESQGTILLREELKKARQDSQDANEATEKAIDKHYRITSKSLHPDRHGEESRPAFELLTKARDLLKITEKRRLYLQQMLDVAGVSPSLVKSSHETFCKRNIPQAETTTTTSQQKPASSTLLIKGGIANDVPRKAYVSILNLQKRKVSIEVPVKLNFCHYCVGIKVLASSGDYEKESLVVASIDKERMEQVGKTMESQGLSVYEIEVTCILPINGIWDVYWNASLLINGQSITTPNSHEARVDLTSQEQKRRRLLIVETDELAKQRAGDILSILRKLRGPRPDHLEIERRCDLLHQVVARGRSTLNRLLDLLRADGSLESSVSGLKPLREALELAGPAKQTLEAQFAQSFKKDSLKSFKHHVAGLLESGEAASWLRTVENDDLQARGGETNRLYQLLVEGKVAHHLELDAATLEAAAGRSDLFTPKQCEMLTQRKVEAEEQVEMEAKRALVEAKEKRVQETKEAAELQAQQRKKAEEERKQKMLQARYEAEREAHLAAIRESEEMARGVVIEHPAHSLVEISGLKSKDGQSLNGTIGTVMHKKGQHYVVKCQIDDKLRSFLPASLNNLGVSSSDLNPASWSCDICTYLHEGDRANATQCDICQNPRDNKAPTAASVTSAPETAPAPAPALAAALAKQQEVASKPKAAKAAPKAKTAKADKSTQPCFHGKNCRFITSANPCKFYHSPEEIEQALANTSKTRHEIYIPDATVGWVIGKGGHHMKEVQRKSRAKVSVDQKRMFPNKTRVVNMTGDQTQIDTAVRMITKLVEEYDDGHGSKFTVNDPGTKSPPTSRSPTSVGGLGTPAARVPPKPESSPPPNKSPISTNGGIAPAARVHPATTSPLQPIQQQQRAVAAQVARSPTNSSPHQQPVAAKPTLISPPKSAYLAPPPPPVAATNRTVTPSSRSSDRLRAFLQDQKACLKGSPEAFFSWLATEDIESLEDLVAAVSDDEYLQEVLQQGDGKVGVKGFKRAAFKKAVLSSGNETSNGHTSTVNEAANDEGAPTELVCPISHVLMTNDPVIAADGHTYERAAIDAWFRKQQMEIAAARSQIGGGNDSQQARSIIDRGVLSPMTHSKMQHLNLTPNLNVRNMAKDFSNGS